MTRQKNDPASIASRILADHAKTFMCITPGCGNRKHGFGRCTPCTDRMARYGSYTGRELPRAYYANEWASASKFVRRFRAHPNIEASRAWITNYLRDSQQGKPTEGQRSVARLADRGNIETIAEMALVELLAVSKYAHTHAGSPLLAPYMMARAFLKSYKALPRGTYASRHSSPPPPYRAPGRPDLEAISRELRKLNSLFIEALAWWDREEVLRNAQLSAQSVPFPNLCERCTYNERKRLEKRRARGGYRPRVYPPGGFNPTGINGNTKKTAGLPAKTDEEAVLKKGEKIGETS